MKKLFQDIFSFCSNKRSVDVVKPTKKPCTENNEDNDIVNNLKPVSRNSVSRSSVKRKGSPSAIGMFPTGLPDGKIIIELINSGIFTHYFPIEKSYQKHSRQLLHNWYLVRTQVRTTSNDSNETGYGSVDPKDASDFDYEISPFMAPRNIKRVDTNNFDAFSHRFLDLEYHVSSCESVYDNERNFSKNFKLPQKEAKLSSSESSLCSNHAFYQITPQGVGQNLR